MSKGYAQDVTSEEDNRQGKTTELEKQQKQPDQEPQWKQDWKSWQEWQVLKQQREGGAEQGSAKTLQATDKQVLESLHQDWSRWQQQQREEQPSQPIRTKEVKAKDTGSRQEREPQWQQDWKAWQDWQVARCRQEVVMPTRAKHIGDDQGRLLDQGSSR